MLDPLIINKLKERYKDIHPLMFHRSVEYAKTNGELFDILDTLPKEYPLMWNAEIKRWVKVEDILLSKDFEE